LNEKKKKKDKKALKLEVGSNAAGETHEFASLDEVRMIGTILEGAQGRQGFFFFLSGVFLSAGGGRRREPELGLLGLSVFALGSWLRCAVEGARGCGGGAPGHGG
jgi:hypothetical protein